MRKHSLVSWIAVTSVMVMAFVVAIGQAAAGLVDDFSSVGNPPTYTGVGSFTFSPNPSPTSWTASFVGPSSLGTGVATDVLSGYTRTTTVTAGQLPNAQSSLIVGMNVTPGRLTYEAHPAAAGQGVKGTLTLTYGQFAGGLLALQADDSLSFTFQVDEGGGHFSDASGISLTDASGATSTQPLPDLIGGPDPHGPHTESVPLSGFSGVNLGDITSVSLVFDTQAANMDFSLGGIVIGPDEPPTPPPHPDAMPEPVSILIWGLVGLTGLVMVCTRVGRFLGVPSDSL